MPNDLRLRAADDFELAATRFDPDREAGGAVLVHSATATPRRFYRHFADALAHAGYTVLTYDFRGIGDSRPANLRGFEATATDWVGLDMTAALDWAKSEFDTIHFVGHSIGGQLAGLLESPERVTSMVTLSAQSGYWGLQGGRAKYSAAFHVHFTFPVLTRLFGYMPWSRLGSAEDLPAGVSQQWVRWCRDPDYVLGDDTLPLDRYRDFGAPILAYSVDDDDWGTARSVDAMMKAYPNVERRHLVPADHGLTRIGHFGFFRPEAEPIWRDVLEWLRRVEAASGSATTA